MIDRTTITLHNPNEFVDFVRRHGLTSPKEDGPVVFCFESKVPLPYNRHHRDDLVTPVAARYSAPVQIFDRIAYVHYETAPDAPSGWAHIEGRRIWRELHAKKDVVTTLATFRIDKDKLKQFDRVKVAQLDELVDSSPADNTNVAELLRRSTQMPPDVLVFKITDDIIDSVSVKMSKMGHSTQMKYELTADFSKHWTDRETSIRRAIEDAKFKVYRGSLGD